MNARQRVAQPLDRSWPQEGQRRLEVSRILWPDVLCLEKQDDLGHQIRNSGRRAADDLLIRQADGFVTAADPGAAIVRLPENVGPVHAGRGLAHPGLVGLAERGAVQRPAPPCGYDIDGVVTQGAAHGTEARGGNADLQVVMVAPLLAAEQVERPAAGDVPVRPHACEPPRDLRWRPGSPYRVGERRAARWSAVVRHASCLP